MKNTFLITASVAALVAGIGLASAQGLNEHRDAPAAATSEQKAPEGQVDHQKSTLPAKSEKLKPAPTAQAPEKTNPTPTAQAPEKTEKMKPATTAQAPEKEKSAPTAQVPEKSDSEHRTVGRRPPKPPRRCGPRRTGAEGIGIRRRRADVDRAEREISGEYEGREG